MRFVRAIKANYCTLGSDTVCSGRETSVEARMEGQALEHVHIQGCFSQEDKAMVEV